MSVLNVVFSPEFFFSIFRVTTPLLFASLAALISNKAGMINIGIEGTMAFAALLGVIVSAFTQNVLLGFIAALIMAVLYSLLLGFITLKLKSHLFLTGIALNLLASGGTVFLMYIVCGDKGTSSSLQSLVLPNVDIPLVKNIPILGEIISGQNIMTYLAFVMVGAVSFFLRKTKLGLRIRAVGENAVAVSTVGVNVNRTKYAALALSGLMSGCGGAFMSMGYVSFFSANMIAGRGFIGIAAEAMGRGMPVNTMYSSLIFGIADTFANTLQMSSIPLQFVQMLPYTVTVVLFTLYAAQSKRASGRKAKQEQ